MIIDTPADFDALSIEALSDLRQKVGGRTFSLVEAAIARKVGGVAAAGIVAAPKPKKAPAHVTGRMNKTEARFERDYLEGRKAQRLNDGWMFEQMKLRLATATWYTVDFAERLAGGGLHMHEVKGGKIWDDAAAKWKIAAEQYPWWSWTLWQWKDGRWRRLRERLA